MHTNLKSLHFHNELNISYLYLCLQSQWYIGIYIHFVILQLLDDLCIFPLWKIVHFQHFVLVLTEQQILCFCFAFSSDTLGYSLSFKIKHIDIYNKCSYWYSMYSSYLSCFLCLFLHYYYYYFFLHFGYQLWRLKRSFSLHSLQDCETFSSIVLVVTCLWIHLQLMEV